MTGVKPPDTVPMGMFRKEPVTTKKVPFLSSKVTAKKTTKKVSKKKTG